MFLIRKDLFDKKFPDIKYSDLGLSSTKILGIDVYCGYCDTNSKSFRENANINLAVQAKYNRKEIQEIKDHGIDGSWSRESVHSNRIIKTTDEKENTSLDGVMIDPEYKQHVKNYEALTWFEENAEKHET